MLGFEGRVMNAVLGLNALSSRREMGLRSTGLANLFNYACLREMIVCFVGARGEAE